jgi:hypothetical protein
MRQCIACIGWMHYDDGDCPFCEVLRQRDEALAELGDVLEERTGICRSCGGTTELRHCRECYNLSFEDATTFERERDDALERLKHAVKREEMWEQQRNEARALLADVADEPFVVGYLEGEHGSEWADRLRAYKRSEGG